MKRATVSARRQSHPVGGCAVLEVQTYSSTVRAVPPTASDVVHRRVRLVCRRASEALKVSKFAVANAVGRTKDELTESDESASALKSLKFQDR